jgi:hypothetical protein
MPPTALIPILLAACAPIALPPAGEDFAITAVDDDSAWARWFDRYSSAFGVAVLASDQVPDDKLLHATFVLAEYLDNDEDGQPDQPVVDAMLDQQAVLIMFGTPGEASGSGIFLSRALRSVAAQDLYAEETAPIDGFDASLEEVLHLVSDKGWAELWPEHLAPEDGSDLCAAMDLARGGHFEGVPSSYPDAAWYHYDDRSCDYPCMATEYLYWALTSMLGAQAQRCDDIADEWEPCTPSLVEQMDPVVHGLLGDPELGLPTTIPDGHYGPAD